MPSRPDRLNARPKVPYLLLCRCKERSDAAGAHTDEHLLEFTAGTEEEGHSSLPCYGTRQQCLAGARWSR